MRLRLLFVAIALCTAFALGRYSVDRQAPAQRTTSTTVAPRLPSTAGKSHSPQPGAASERDRTKDTLRIASFETLLFAQPYMFADALKQLRPSTPGHPSLYAIGFAGDGDEKVFRNEVEYLSKLLAGRFGAADHTLQLIMSPDTYTTIPLATRTNLDNAIESIASKMNRDDDILLLFLTSHGSRDHELLVKMGDLPFDQVNPGLLRYALDNAHIRWRVIVVSACYSGGFIPALEEPHTMIITAARADRTSFGCGSDAQLTWFGKAFLTEALNQTTDFHEAFDRASKTIAAWEKQGHEKPSEPQFREGKLVEQHLAAWRATLPAGAPVAFVPAAPPTRHAGR